MTTSTQAQIEAAAKAIRDVEEPEMPVSEFMKHAEAALTAAAEVRRLDLWKGTADPQVTRKITAAAEIGGQSGQAPVSLTSRWESPASPASRQGGPTAAAEAGEKESAMEHIARDIREGRFPTRSEPLVQSIRDHPFMSDHGKDRAIVIFDIVNEVLKISAPGIGELVREGIARSIAMRIALDEEMKPAAATRAGEPKIDPVWKIDQSVKAIRNATIERCAQYHDNAAKECDKIAAVNMDNDLGLDCITRAQDHRVDAAAIRALKDQP